ncbi:MAG TPA: hypothetical protein VMX17_01000 [Candidatus Glassbacteria bacterium]|nr:hypothetical protein [Candidatus Glassbacteria bacterium]
MAKKEKGHTYAHLEMWETVRQDCKYPESDQNKGFIYGVYWVFAEKKADLEELWFADYEVQWFKSAEAREKFIVKNKFKMVD